MTSSNRNKPGTHITISRSGAPYHEPYHHDATRTTVFNQYPVSHTAVYSSSSHRSLHQSSSHESDDLIEPKISHGYKTSGSLGNLIETNGATVHYVNSVSSTRQNCGYSDKHNYGGGTGYVNGDNISSAPVSGYHGDMSSAPASGYHGDSRHARYTVAERPVAYSSRSNSHRGVENGGSNIGGVYGGYINTSECTGTGNYGNLVHEQPVKYYVDADCNCSPHSTTNCGNKCCVYACNYSNHATGSIHSNHVGSSSIHSNHVGSSGNHGSIHSNHTTNNHVSGVYVDGIHKKLSYTKDSASTGRAKSYENLVDDCIPHSRSRDLTSWQQGQGQAYKIPDSVHTSRLIESKDYHTTSQKNASATVIREQEAMIEKLKTRLLMLEQHNSNQTTKLHHAVVSNTDLHETKIMELEAQNKSLKSKMAEMTANKTTAMDSLEIKLGAAEHEILHLKARVHENKMEGELKKAEGNEKLQEKTNKVEELTKENAKLKADHQSNKEKLETTERYLSELKSAEENQRDSAELTQLRDKTVTQKSHIDELVKKLTYAKKIITEKNTRIKELEVAEKLMNDKLVNREKELERLRSVGDGALLKTSEHNLFTVNREKELERLRSVGDGALLKTCEHNLFTVTGERDRLHQDLIKAKQVIELCKRNAHEAALKHTNILSDLQERLLREEASSDGLRQELGAREELVINLKNNIKEVYEEKQNLEEDNLNLKSKISQHETKHSPQTQDLQAQLVHEVSSCYSDLQSLVNVCMQRAEGQEPNISSLLGMNVWDLQSLVNVCMQTAEGKEPNISCLLGMNAAASLLSPTTDPRCPDQPSSPLLRCKLDKVRDTRAQLDRLRSMVVNKFAEDLGDRLTCAIQ